MDGRRMSDWRPGVLRALRSGKSVIVSVDAPSRKLGNEGAECRRKLSDFADFLYEKGMLDGGFDMAYESGMMRDVGTMATAEFVPDANMPFRAGFDGRVMYI